MKALKDNNKYKLKKDTVRSYYKEDTNVFVQPVLSSNGTLGGNYFAVSGGRYNEAYKGFDGNSSTYVDIRFDASYPLIFYNPKTLNISSILFNWNNPGGYWASGTNGILYGSNDGSNWIAILNGFGGHTSDGTLNVSVSNFSYKYGKIEFPSATSYNVARANEITITATETVITEGTENDYDFYVDANTYYAF